MVINFPPLVVNPRPKDFGKTEKHLRGGGQYPRPAFLDGIRLSSLIVFLQFFLILLQSFLKTLTGEMNKRNNS